MDNLGYIAGIACIVIIIGIGIFSIYCWNEEYR